MPEKGLKAEGLRSKELGDDVNHVPWSLKSFSAHVNQHHSAPAYMRSTSTTSSCDNAPVNVHAKPRYGSRLLPQVVDELARSDPNRIYATLPLSSDLARGFLDVTMLQVSQAVSECAYWLEHTIGRSSDFETLSYMGLPDLRYAIIFLAAVKCGYKVSGKAPDGPPPISRRTVRTVLLD